MKLYNILLFIIIFFAVGNASTGFDLEQALMVLEKVLEASGFTIDPTSLPSN